MADIFLSYTEKDRDAVWWDRRIPAGLSWRNVLERELQQMRCMVVLWSQHSVASEWVCEEAAEGRQLGRLVPVLLENVRPPAGFREIQAADLVDWDGSPQFPGLQRLVEDIERLIGQPGAAAQSPSKPETTHRAPGSAAPAAPRPALAASSIIARCVALRERLALGETLSGPSQILFRQECSK
ncbi:MAG: toll/interleukin-1 receptor domain-containing protein [Burkholderiaceae bacterium]